MQNSPWTDLEGSRRLRIPDFKTVGTGLLYPQLLNSVIVWVEPRATVRPGNIPLTRSEFEPATLRLVAQCLNQLRHHCVSLGKVIVWFLTYLSYPSQEHGTGSVLGFLLEAASLVRRCVGVVGYLSQETHLGCFLNGSRAHVPYYSVICVIVISSNCHVVLA